MAAPTRPNLVTTVLFALWAAFVLVAYLARPVPYPTLLSMAFRVPEGAAFSPTRFAGFWMGALGQVLTALLVLLAWWFAGRRFRALLSLKGQDDFLPRFPIEMGLGALLWSTLFYGLALVKLWHPLLLLSLLGGASLAALLEIFSLPFKVDRTTTDTLGFIKERPFLTGLGVLTLLFVLMHDAAPETYMDSLVYHLGFLSHWLENRGWADMPMNSYITFPIAGDLLFLPGVLLRSPETAKFLHAGVLLLAALLLAGWAREWGGQSAGGWMVGLVLTLPMLSLNAWTVQVEGIQAFFVLLFFYSLQQSVIPGPDVRWALAAGLTGGMALAVKYTSASALAAGVLGAAAVIVTTRSLRRSALRWVPAALAASIGVLLTAGPWLFRNLVVRGNPLAPYLGGLFNQPVEPFYSRALWEFSQYPGAEGTPFWMWPWKWAMDRPSLFNFPGPLALACLPLLFSARWKEPRLRFLGILTVLYFAFGLAQSGVSRFLIPLFLVLYLLSALELHRFVRRPAFAEAACVLVGAANLALLMGLSGVYFQCGGLWRGAEGKQAYLERVPVHGHYALARRTDEAVPRDAKLLLLGEARGYYFHRSYLARMAFDPPLFFRAFRDAPGPEAFHRWLLRQGITHVVVDGWHGLGTEKESAPEDRLGADEWRRLGEYVRSYWEPLVPGERQAVYRVKAQPGTPAGPETARPLFLLSEAAAR